MLTGSNRQQVLVPVARQESFCHEKKLDYIKGGKQVILSYGMKSIKHNLLPVNGRDIQVLQFFTIFIQKVRQSAAAPSPYS